MKKYFLSVLSLLTVLSLSNVFAADQVAQSSNSNSTASNATNTAAITPTATTSTPAVATAPATTPATTTAPLAPDAANQSTASSGYWNKLKESPLKMMFIESISPVSDPEEPRKWLGFNAMNYVYLTYGLSPKDSVQFENIYQYQNQENEDSVHKWYRSTLRYTRSGILTQKNHGINLSAGFEERFLPNYDMRKNYNQYGHNRFYLKTTRTFGNLYLSGTYYYTFVNVKDRNLQKQSERGMKTTSTQNLYIVLTQAYNFTEKFYTALTEEFYQTYGSKLEGKNDVGGLIDVTLEFGYSFNDTISMDITAGSEPVVAHDGRTFTPEIWKNLAYGMDIILNVF